MSRSDLAALRQVPIVQVAEALGHEVLRGNRIRCPKPEAHAANYTRPTMSLDLRRNRAHCFACDADGSPLDLIAWSRHCSLTEAAAYAAKINGAATVAPAARPAPRPAAESREATAQDLAVFQTLMDLCVRVETVPEIKDYVARRLPTAWDTFDRIGLRAVADAEVVATALRERHSDEALRQAGVINAENRFRFFHHRLIFFFLKTDRRPHYFQARHLGVEQPRFLNPIGIKVPCLMAQVSLRGARRWDDFRLAEGFFDTLTLNALGLPTVGLPGTGVADTELLRVLTKFRVTYIPQNDEAGAASIRTVERVLRWLTVLRLPGEGDINDHLARLGEDALFDLVIGGQEDDE